MAQHLNVNVQTEVSVRETDPNVLQRRASDPFSSVWVGASAGTGKTKVLTDRVLRLLLPRSNGDPATPAHKILCLTYTKAAASEMMQRLSKELSDWAVLPRRGEAAPDVYSLDERLRSLLGRDAREEEVAAARRLFAEVVDVPGGLKITTIHSFCQSILGRFPLEAGISPQFKALEEDEAFALLERAKLDLFNAPYDASHPVFGALGRLAQALDEDRFMSVLRAVVGERRQFESILGKYFGVEGFYTALCGAMGVRAGETVEDFMLRSCLDEVFDGQGLREAARLMIDLGGVSDKKHGQFIADWLALSAAERAGERDFSSYKMAFFTTKGELRAKLCSNAVVKAMPEAPGVLLREAQRLENFLDEVNSLNVAVLTRDICLVCEEILLRYKKIKMQQSALDFDDMILKVRDFLAEDRGGIPNARWVQYKLDQGIDHILVDEAQDTNPEQWEILQNLTQEFFAGDGASDVLRTFFAVGDEKQSIYSFQRASPEKFSQMRGCFRQRVEAVRQVWDDVDMNISFRSTRAVLRAVDAVFETPEMRRGLGDKAIEHEAWRRGQAGLVELWPLFEPDEKDKSVSLWEPPLDVQISQSGSVKLAAHMAQTIKGWIGHEMLPSHGRSVQAGDIMILLRRRNAFAQQLSRALKTLGVPVGGLDRMALGEQLAVQDLLAAARFALLPEDDLSLACFLKSPLVGLDEDGLYRLAAGREGSLWAACAKGLPQDLYAYLQTCLRRASSASVYEFFSGLLQDICPGDAVSGWRAFVRRLGTDVEDVLDEFLNSALDFEQRTALSLQHFIYAQERKESEIKREMDEAGGHVRIMTVHGSKGLQAPIVFLPDTVAMGGGANNAGRRFLWPHQTGVDFMMFAPRKEEECRYYEKARAVLEAREDDESRRLLYVAMTRAEDRLYVAGYKGKNNPPEGCWYNLVRAGLQRLDGLEERDGGALRYEIAQLPSHDPDRRIQAEACVKAVGDLPGWVYERVHVETASSSYVNPSHMQDLAASPVGGADEMRFLRGNLTHKLLQVLPSLDPALWAESAQRYVERYGRDFDADIRAGIVHEVMAILNHPEFAPIFGFGSRAEVPLAGLLADGQTRISGQVDRLLVTDRQVFIIDYKTNRPPPRDQCDIPQGYIRQMQAYAEILQRVYPGKTMRAALLWTDGPTLMDVDLDL